MVREPIKTMNSGQIHSMKMEELMYFNKSKHVKVPGNF